MKKAIFICAIIASILIIGGSIGVFGSYELMFLTPKMSVEFSWIVVLLGFFWMLITIRQIHENKLNIRMLQQKHAITRHELRIALLKIEIKRLSNFKVTKKDLSISIDQYEDKIELLKSQRNKMTLLYNNEKNDLIIASRIHTRVLNKGKEMMVQIESLKRKITNLRISNTKTSNFNTSLRSENEKLGKRLAALNIKYSTLKSKQ